MTQKFEIGQKLFYQSAQRFGRSEYVTVTKVGRLWVEIGHERFPKADLPQYTEDRRSRIWLTEQDYTTARNTDQLWSALRDGFGRMYRRPDHIGADTIRQIAGLLKIELPT